MTQAEKAKSQFENATKTISIVEIARRFDATRLAVRNDADGLKHIHYVFPDHSVLITSGRGNNHRLWLGEPQ